MSIDEVRAFFNELQQRWPDGQLGLAEQTLQELVALLQKTKSGTTRDEPNDALTALQAATEAVTRARKACRAADALSQTYAGDL